ncbi:uncharacterized protein IL334_006118 [Kwoniella shivajii]|uniref:Uracil-DNA glycosylase-like domain-containing protein n=1 Tax=Kwoniella shivajii TaxID=564305 RepID=A0ABZ1D6L7_9TREE|nr:hypothetical protein IL334_006118 [Kwoniella shivajii]
MSLSSPGKRSSTMGHHFSHPTNKFWVRFTESISSLLPPICGIQINHVANQGLTPRLLDPTEDQNMPQYGYGLTNLVDRPTSEQSELSTLEMRLNVFNLTLKFLLHRPKIVCFVGKKIWDVYESVISKTAMPIVANRNKQMAVNESMDEWTRKYDEDNEESKLTMDIPGEEDDHKLKIKEEIVDAIPLNGDDDHLVKNEGEIPSISESSLSPPPLLSPPASKFEHEAELVKMESAYTEQTTNHIPTPTKKTARSKKVVEQFDPTKPRKYRLPLPLPSPPQSHMHTQMSVNGQVEKAQEWTYFWVVPNTSGLERTPLSEQIINFTALKTFLNHLNDGLMPETEDWKEIDTLGVERTVETMKLAAMAKSA